MKNASMFVISVMLIVIVCGCLGQSPLKPTNVSYAHYQLQNTSFDGLQKLNIAMLIIDIDDSGLDATHVQELKDSGKTVLSYLSIGEAETYRDYWQLNWTVGNPPFIDAENPDWPGNFKVKYWDPTWQAIVFDKVKKIAELGYNGVYLDIIDAYQYYDEQGRRTAATEMIEFVSKIKQQGLAYNRKFIVVPQNSPELYAYSDYKRAIDGLGKESTWYVENYKQSDIETASTLQFLDQAVRDGKFVIAIDYPTDMPKICDFYAICQAHSFVCTISNRALSANKPAVCTII